MIEYNKEVEVNQKQYNALITKCEGIIAYREENNQFFIKLLLPTYASYVSKILTLNK